MRTLSLFSGYGGLDLAVEEVLGAETAYVADIDKGACKILAHRFPHAENLGDVSKVDYRSLGDIDVITGGFPCQDVSTAGKRAGMKDGTRSGLWAEMRRAIEELRPGLVVIENVRGLLSAEADSDVEPCPWCLGDDAGPNMRALGAVHADLADIGFHARWCGLRAADVGAPHGRFRVFVVASPADTGSEHREQRRQPAPRQTPGGWALGELARSLYCVWARGGAVMTPQEQADWANGQLARMVHAKHTSDDLARAVGGLVRAADECGAAWVVAVRSWLRLIGGQR